MQQQRNNLSLHNRLNKRIMNAPRPPTLNELLNFWEDVERGFPMVYSRHYNVINTFRSYHQINIPGMIQIQGYLRYLRNLEDPNPQFIEGISDPMSYTYIQHFLNGIILRGKDLDDVTYNVTMRTPPNLRFPPYQGKGIALRPFPHDIPEKQWGGGISDRIYQDQDGNSVIVLPNNEKWFFDRTNNNWYLPGQTTIGTRSYSDLTTRLFNIQHEQRMDTHVRPLQPSKPLSGLTYEQKVRGIIKARKMRGEVFENGMWRHMAHPSRYSEETLGIKK